MTRDYTSNLRSRLQKFRDEAGIKINSIADQSGCELTRLYQFSSGNQRMYDDEAIRLHAFLKDRGY